MHDILNSHSSSLLHPVSPLYHHHILTFKFITELLPEDDHCHQYDDSSSAAAAQGYRSDQNGFPVASATENGADNGVDSNNHQQQHHPSLGMGKTNPFAALAAVHQQQQLNSPITANRQSPLQLRQASPFPHESTNSRRKQFHSNATAASTTTSAATPSQSAGTPQQDTIATRKHRSNLTTNGGGE